MYLKIVTDIWKMTVTKRCWRMWFGFQSLESVVLTVLGECGVDCHWRVLMAVIGE